MKNRGADLYKTVILEKKSASKSQVGFYCCFCCQPFRRPIAENFCNHSLQKVLRRATYARFPPLSGHTMSVKDIECSNLVLPSRRRLYLGVPFRTENVCIRFFSPGKAKCVQRGVCIPSDVPLPLSRKDSGEQPIFARKRREK